MRARLDMNSEPGAPLIAPFAMSGILTEAIHKAAADS